MPMNTSEPTTTEIRRFLQGLASEVGMLPISKRFLLTAADRIESQEQKIAEVTASRDRMTDAVAELKMKVGELTARAEQAERERDAAIKDTRCGGCTNCKYHHYLPTVQRHEKCNTCRDRSNYEWRGLPQEGNGK